MIPIRSSGPGGKKPNKVGHVSPAYEQPLAVNWVADQLGDPADRLSFDLSCHRCQHPRADVRIGGGREQIAEDSDWGGRRRDVTPEPGMAVEQRVVEYQTCGLLKQALRVGSVIGELVLRAQSLTHHGGRFPGRHGPLRQRGKEIGDSIDELVSQASKLLRGDFDGGLAVSKVLNVLIILHGCLVTKN